MVEQDCFPTLPVHKELYCQVARLDKNFLAPNKRLKNEERAHLLNSFTLDKIVFLVYSNSSGPRTLTTEQPS